MRRVNGLFFTLLLIGALVLTGPQQALGNGMPAYPRLGPLTGSILPVAEQRVGILGEELQIKAEAHKLQMVDNPDVELKVSVTYNLQNYAADRLNIPVAFPQGGSTGNWSVLLDSNPIQPEGEKDIASDFMPEQDYAATWLDPNTGQQYAAEKVLPARQLQAQTFSLSLSPGPHSLQVSYMADAGVDELRGLNPVYRFDYLLTPAAYWRDFQNLKISVQVPAGYKLSSSIPLERVGSTNWQANLAQLPKGDLHIFFSPTEGSWGGLIHTKPEAVLFLLAAVGVLLVVRRILSRNTSLWLYVLLDTAVSGAVVWTGYVTFSRPIFPYPFTALQYLCLWALIVWLAVTLAVRIYRVSGRKNQKASG